VTYPELRWLARSAQRVGVVVPPSNPVVEPELKALVGDDVVVFGARLSRHPDLSLEERNRLYVPGYHDALDELFGLDVVCALVAMTGPNYRFGVDGDRDLCADLTARFNAPVRTASLAIHDYLIAMGISRIHLVSPYPDWLTDEAVSYWTGGAMNVVGVDHMLGEGERFHAYDTHTDEVVSRLRAVDPEPGAAVLLTGTGLVTIAAIHELAPAYVAPILSSNLCGAWWILQHCPASPGSDLYQQIVRDNPPGDGPVA